MELPWLNTSTQAKQKSKQASLPYGDSEMQEPDESTYRYDGPRPRFKESAIIFCRFC